MYERLYERAKYIKDKHQEMRRQRCVLHRHLIDEAMHPV